MKIEINVLEAVGATYAVLSKAFSYPDQELWDSLEGHALEELIGDVDSSASGLDGHYVFPVRGRDERTSTYLNLFELGKMPLYEGSFRPYDGREGIQDELLRFYHCFNLKLGKEKRDYPDHITTELEFMMYLVGLEAAALNEARDPKPVRSAQKDFLDRHVRVWATEMGRRRFESDRGVYATLAHWLDAFTRWHRHALEEALADVRPNTVTHTSHEGARHDI